MDRDEDANDEFYGNHIDKVDSLWTSRDDSETETEQNGVCKNCGHAKSGSVGDSWRHQKGADLQKESAEDWEEDAANVVVVFPLKADC